MRVLILLMSFLLLFSTLSNAKSSSEYDALYANCVDENEPINNMVVAKCSAVVSDKAMAEISRRYQSIHLRFTKASPEALSSFEMSQKAWIQYRNTHCDLAGRYVGQPMFDFCPMKMNAARALELRMLDSD